MPTAHPEAAVEGEEQVLEADGAACRLLLKLAHPASGAQGLFRGPTPPGPDQEDSQTPVAQKGTRMPESAAGPGTLSMGTRTLPERQLGSPT